MIGGVILFLEGCSYKYFLHLLCLECDRLVLYKVEWWRLVWHKHVVSCFSFILWLAIWDTFRLRISSCFIVSFRPIGVSCVGVAVKMLITYFLIAPSLSAFGMTCALNASFLSIIVLGLVPLYGLLS